MVRIPIDVPIACTLDAGQLDERLAEWHELLAAATSSERSPERAAFGFAVDPATAARLGDLTAREVGCCGFFEFQLTLAAGGMELGIAVPAGAGAALDSLVGGR